MFKPKGKAMSTTQDDDSNESEQETQSSEEDSLQEIKAFMAYGSPLSSLCGASDLSSEA